MADGIQFFAKNSGLGYGLAIIIVTLIVRIIILPLGIYQSWKATLQSEKMNYFKPIFAPIQERIKNAETQEEKMQAQQELMADTAEVSPADMGLSTVPTRDRSFCCNAQGQPFSVLHGIRDDLNK